MIYLEVTSNDEQVDAIPAALLGRLLDGSIYRVERAMALKIQSISGVGKDGKDKCSAERLTQPSTAIRTPCDSKAPDAIFLVVGYLR